MHKISCVLGILLTASAAYADAPPPDPVAIELVAANGSGCPRGTSVSLTAAPDNTGFTVTFDEFMALVGVGASSIDFRKNCQFNVLVRTPPEFTFAVDAAHYQGFASLAAGANATKRTSYFFQGQTGANVERRISGPVLDDWEFEDRSELASVVFAPCGALRNLNIDIVISVSRGTSDPTTTTSFFAIDPPASFHLVWKRCPL